MAKKKPGKPNPSYVLPKGCDFPGFRILAVDPGSKNFGIAVVGLSKGKPVILANSCLQYPVNSLVDFTETREAFLTEIHRWVTLYKPNAIIGERFQTRGNGGPLIEQVSTMLGLLAGRYYPLPVRLITASTWKNKFCRRFSEWLARKYPVVAAAVATWVPAKKTSAKAALKAMPKKALKKPKLDLPLLYRDLQITPHAFDACLIGIYGLEFGFKKELYYTPQHVVSQAEATSLLGTKPSVNSRSKKK